MNNTELRELIKRVERFANLSGQWKRNLNKPVYREFELLLKNVHDTITRIRAEFIAQGIYNNQVSLIFSKVEHTQIGRFLNDNIADLIS